MKRTFTLLIALVIVFGLTLTVTVSHDALKNAKQLMAGQKEELTAAQKKMVESVLSHAPVEIIENRGHMTVKTFY
jgi:hypothetical protein